MNNDTNIDVTLDVPDKVSGPTNLSNGSQNAQASSRSLQPDNATNSQSVEKVIAPNQIPPSLTASESAAPKAPAKQYFGLSMLHWLYLLALWAATVLTFVISQNLNQFENQGAVAFEQGFPGDLEQWARRGGWDNVLFEPNAIVVNRIEDNAGYALRTFPLASSENRHHEKLRVTGSVNTLTKKAEDDLSDGGAVMLWLQDDSDEVVTYLNIGKLDGKQDSYEVSRVVNLTDDITRYSVVLTNKESTAEFALVDASVELLVEKPLFSQIRIVVLAVWAILLAIALRYLFKRASLAMFAVVSAAIVLTIIGVLMPETWDSATIKPFYAKLQALTGLTGDAILEHAYKLGHFLFFFSITLMLLLYRKTLELPVWEIFVLMVLFALATEGMQLYLSDRTSRISDLIIDVSAVFIAAMFVIMIGSLKQEPNKKAPIPPSQ